MNEPVHIFGIRHHGPGSARSLRAALESLQPDVVLIEGPPDADGAIALAGHTEMRPPVALLVYVPDQPQRSAFYPFALFSPEWQAMRYALAAGVPVRFMDLPLLHRLALEPVVPEAEPAPEGEAPEATGAAPEREEEAPPGGEPVPDPDGDSAEVAPDLRTDPLRWLAEAAGYSDSERWWDHLVEQRRDCGELFAAIMEAMTALRREAPPESPERARIEALREAWMRKTVRAAVREGFQRIAVVCGAWHAPALAEMPPAKEDNALLQGLPKVKTQATWVPWTHGRLSYRSGYGAGIVSPGWYEHVWSFPEETSVRWLTRVARLLREEDLDASSAHIIEATRLADSLAALRGRPLPALEELNEATQTVLCFGNPLPMQLIHERLIVGEVLGQVPEETPTVPLQQDLAREQKRLRLPPDATAKSLDLDLRKSTDLERSHLLHRMGLLGLPWGRQERHPSATSTRGGTFHELWKLQWQPDFAVGIIEAAGWGNTVDSAADARARDLAREALKEHGALPALTALLDRCLLAELPGAAHFLLERIQSEAAVAGDAVQLMRALPPLARAARYGSVRRADAELVERVVDGLAPRIFIGLLGACSSLDDAAAAEMLERLMEVHFALNLLRDSVHLAGWREALTRLSDQQGVHGLVAGRGTRLLLDAGALDAEEAARRLGLALSRAAEPAQAAAWIQGFLGTSGQLLLHDRGLWQVLDDWLAGLAPDTFTQLLPLLRRTFSAFPAPERRQMGELARRGHAGSPRAATFDVDPERAARVLPVVRRLLGLDVQTCERANV